MSQSYTPEFKKKIVRLHIEEDVLTKASLKLVYQKPVSPNGVLNLARCHTCSELLRMQRQ